VHRLDDVFPQRQAEIAHLQIEPRRDFSIGVLGKADRAWPGGRFEPRGDVDAVPHELAITFLDDVANVNPNAEDDAPIVGYASVVLDHRVLDRDGATHGVDHAAELGQEPSPLRLTMRRRYTSLCSALRPELPQRPSLRSAC
jgi:hypothetical protein